MFFSRILFLILLFTTYSSYGLQLQQDHSAPKANIDTIEKRVIRYRYDQPDSAIYYARMGLKLAKVNNDQDGIARMLNQLGMIDDNLGKAEDSRQKYLEALEIYKRLDDKKGIIKENIRLGVVEKRKGNYDKASAYFLYALKTSEKSKDQAGIMESYITLGEVYGAQKKHVTAIEYYKRAERISQTLPFSSLKLNLYIDMGNSYQESDMFPQAEFYFKKAISQSNYPQMMGLYITATSSLARLYIKSGRLDEAIELQKSALIKSRQIDNFIREFGCLVGLADCYKGKDAKIALSYLQQALSLARSHKANKQTLEVLTKIADLETSRNNFKAAYEAKNQQYNIADSFYFKDISLKIADLQAQYELNKSEVKVQELRFINSKQALEKKIMLGITIGSLVLLIVLGGYFFKIKKLNQLLNQSNTALTESNTVKDKLFSVLAHDLRAPLAAVINLVEMINKGWLDEDEKTIMMTKLALHCNASMETLNLLLKWGQMQLNGIRINQIILSPLEVINRNVSLFSEAARQKSITINTHCPADLQVFSDADHLDFIIRNLLSNAIKFTYEGGQIGITAVRDTINMEVLFMVKDNGVGIEEERLESIFNTNSVSTVGTNNEKGTSLGLVICKEFILANNGRIWAESIAGEGSSLFFTLKYK